MKDKIISYWDNDAKGYNKNNISGYHQQKKIWTEIISEPLNKGPLDALDIGTGPGVVAFILAEMGHRVTGIDLSEEMLHCARHNADTLHLEVNFQKGDAERVPFADESFDAVVNRYVLWTLPQPEKAISEWFRVLKPGGKVVIIDGTWYVGKSLKKRAWRVLSSPLIMATEGRNLLLNDFDLHVKNKLPLAQAKRPERDIELLKRYGFREVSTKPISFNRTSSFFGYIKRGYWGDSFLVQGVK
jgi:SAM-dependent methyltransferase